jgi:AbrB family looped-hinge helix DNA binding protein
MVEVIGKIARNGHITIPGKIRKMLNIEDGDIIKFNVEGNKITITPGVIIDKNQAYFFKKETQEQIKKSEKEFKEGKYSSFASSQDLKKEIESE